MNNVTEIKNEKLGESYYEIKHQSGLKILVYPKRTMRRHTPCSVRATAP